MGVYTVSVAVMAMLALCAVLVGVRAGACDKFDTLREINNLLLASYAVE
jgi:hypothetical protein